MDAYRNATSICRPRTPRYPLAEEPHRANTGRGLLWKELQFRHFNPLPPFRPKRPISKDNFVLFGRNPPGAHLADRYLVVVIIGR